MVFFSHFLGVSIVYFKINRHLCAVLNKRGGLAHLARA